MEPHFIRTANDRTSTVNRNENRSVQLLMALQSNSDHIKGLLRHQTTSSIVDNPPSQLLAEKQTQNSLEKKIKKCIDPHAVFTSTTDSSTLAATQKVVDLHLWITTATARKLGEENSISGKSEQSS